MLSTDIGGKVVRQTVMIEKVLISFILPHEWIKEFINFK